MYPKGPYRPESAVQRGAVQFLPIYPAIPRLRALPPHSICPTPNVFRRTSSPPTSPASPATRLSYQDAGPILRALGGKQTPHGWQGALPFTYHLGAPVRYRSTCTSNRTPGAGSSGTSSAPSKAPMPHRKTTGSSPATIATPGSTARSIPTPAPPPCSKPCTAWASCSGRDGSPSAASCLLLGCREEGLIGSTEWAEQHESQLQHAVAYFNTDVGVSGPAFTAAAVPSLKQFVREVTKEVPSPQGGTVYEAWEKSQKEDEETGTRHRPRATHQNNESGVHVGDLGSGSDYTPFLQHLGVPATDIGSEGPYGVYHSVFDNYNWFIKFADPTFVYEQQQARVFGLEILHMADADVLPYDYKLYAQSVASYLDTAEQDATTAKLQLDFAPARAATKRFEAAAIAILARQTQPSGNLDVLNAALRGAEAELLNPQGLPKRPWFRHTIYAPGEYTGYAAVVLPGVTEAISAPDAQQASAQLAVLAQALNRAAGVLEAAAK